jgi:hypothetical protein
MFASELVAVVVRMDALVFAIDMHIDRRPDFSGAVDDGWF